jgi:iron(III) transport system permease protein
MSVADRLAEPFDRGEGDVSTGLVLLSGAIAAAVLSPVVWLVMRVAQVDTSYALSVLLRPGTVAIALRSLALVTVVTGASILIGVPLAFLTVRTDIPFPRFWTVAVALPLVIPSYIGAFTFLSAFGPNGQLVDVLAPLGIESIPSIYGFAGAALVLTLFTYPYVFITTRASLLSFDRTLVEAGRTLGVSRWTVFRRVTLPQLVPGITSGALLVALYTLSDFGTPAMMRASVFTQAIYVEFNAFGRETAAMLSVLLLAITAAILAIESQVGDSTQGAYVGTSAGRTGSADVSLGAWRWPATLFPLAIATLCLVVPVGILLVWLLRGAAGGTRTGIPFEWGIALNSVSVSVAAALACALCALPIAYLAARSRSTLAELFDRATYVGYAMPGIVLGLALVFFGAAYVPVLYQTIPLLVFAYVVRFLPQAVGATRSSVLRVDRSLTEAARTLGRSPIATFRAVTIPLIMPGVLAGAALVFLTTMKELPATLLLHPTGFGTLVTYIWQVRSVAAYGSAAVPALALIAVSSLSMLIIISQEE